MCSFKLFADLHHLLKSNDQKVYRSRHELRRCHVPEVGGSEGDSTKKLQVVESEPPRKARACVIHVHMSLKSARWSL